MDPDLHQKFNEMKSLFREYMKDIKPDDQNYGALARAMSYIECASFDLDAIAKEEDIKYSHP